MSALLGAIGLLVAIGSILLPAFQGGQLATVGVAIILLSCLNELIAIKKALVARRQVADKRPPQKPQQ